VERRARSGRRPVVAAIIRSLAVGGIAGLAAGIAVAGIGGRLVMRLAALADPSADGLLTDNGNRVGDITLGGTIELLIFGGIFGGIFAGIIWVLVRPWLARLGQLRAMGAAAVAVAAGSPTVVNAENPDFAILDPAALNAATFLTILALFGIAVSLADSWLDRRLPAGDRLIPTAIYALLALVGLPFIIPAIGILLSEEFCDCGGPPRLTGTFVVAAGVITVVSWVLVILKGDQAGPPRWLRIAGELAVLGIVITGVVYTGNEVDKIVSG
jgi:hypothetical protein